MKKPIIGISFDWEQSGSFSKREYYALRKSYFDAITKSGGVPIGIPFDFENMDRYSEMIDGLVIPGGGFPSKKEWYIDDGYEDKYQIPSPRLEFDIEFFKKCRDKNIPILGICAGMQIISCVSGCKITRNINKFQQTKIDHSEGVDAEFYCHKIITKEGSLIRKIVGREVFDVNSTHVEAIVDINSAPNIEISGYSEDGVIEVIELKNHRFCLGVQFHPEFFLEEGNPNFLIFTAFIDECNNR